MLRKGGRIMKTISKMGVAGLIVALLLSVSSVVLASDHGKKTPWHGEDEPPGMIE